MRMDPWKHMDWWDKKEWYEVANGPELQTTQPMKTAGLSLKEIGLS